MAHRIHVGESLINTARVDSCKFYAKRQRVHAKEDLSHKSATIDNLDAGQVQLVHNKKRYTGLTASRQSRKSFSPNGNSVRLTDHASGRGPRITCDLRNRH